MEWSFSDDRPIWQQLTEQITLRILKGEYPAGSRLPAVRELAAQAGVNPNTMQRAMAQLEQNGLAVSSRTAGRTVTDDITVIQQVRRERAHEAVAQYLNIIRELGYCQADAITFLKEVLQQHE
ncbi:MAG: GntR family transcriptional regulator [Oscillospiraceae bacterium]|nr:GntR family transcriptional regulator [Oscillospiraceae bacterium]